MIMFQGYCLSFNSCWLREGLHALHLLKLPNMGIVVFMRNTHTRNSLYILITVELERNHISHVSMVFMYLSDIHICSLSLFSIRIIYYKNWFSFNQYIISMYKRVRCIRRNLVINEHLMKQSHLILNLLVFRENML